MKNGLDMMRHAVGFPKLYRNYYDCGNEQDSAMWALLVTLGLAEFVHNNERPLYRVSEAGIAHLKKLRSLERRRALANRIAAQKGTEP